jgi:lipoprotein-anchoring transpeptidase ErfK/SrfK
MRRLWLAVLLVPVLALAMLALAMPGGASAASSARLAGAARAARAAPGRPVRFGMSGSAVTALQRRLAALKYYPGPADGRFGLDTLEAVWAFQEVQGLPGADYVSSAMQRALAHPHAPQLLVPRGGADRIEINLARRVLVLYRGGKVELISHVSAGGGYYYCSSGGCGYAVTPTGNFRTLSFMPGWIAVPLGYMYNPVFFIGTAYAIHGDIPVPLQPVSHGCVRIPMDIAAFFHTLVRIPGEPVYIRR